MLEKLKKLKVNIGWRSLILIGVCAVLIFVDLITKYFAEKDGWIFTVIPNFIEVEKVSYNDGCAFSFLSGAQPFLIAMTFILLALLIFVFIVMPERLTLLKIAVSMIIAGAIGNLVDRIAFFKVRDFVMINMGFSSPLCNFADFWIVIGTVIAVIDTLFFNEWALIPLTKSAKAAQAKRKEEEEKGKAESAKIEKTQLPDTGISETDENGSDDKNG